MKTACIYHSIDLDGWMSAAIVKKFYNENEPEAKVDFIGWTHGQEIPDLREYGRVVMVDIAFPAAEMALIAKHVQVKSPELTPGFIWLDHHKSSIENINQNWPEDVRYTIHGKQNVSFAACELTWKYFFKDTQMPEMVRMLGRYDCFGHKGTAEERDVLLFQYAARSEIDSVESAYAFLSGVTGSHAADQGWKQSFLNNGHSIYKYLCVEAQQAYSQKKDVVFAFDSKFVKFAMVNKERFNPVNFGIDYHKDGYDGFCCFSFTDGQWKFSIYNDNGNVDCSLLASSLGGGGHKGAAGFVLNNDRFNEFIETVIKP